MHGGTKELIEGMNVFLLIEEYEQDNFINKRGERASPYSSVMGVYEEKEKAEKEKQHFEEQSNKNERCSYFLEERPLL